MSRPAWVMMAAHNLPGSDAWLSPQERLVLCGYELPRRRGDWRLGRWAAKNSILAALDEPGIVGLAEIEVLAAADGAPEVSFRGSPAPIGVSISHRDGVAVSLACPAGTVVGCDLELIEPRTRAFAADWFTPGELRLVDASLPEARDERVTMIWSAKESVLKAVRQGLRLDTRDVEVMPSGEGAPFENGWRRFGATYAGRQLAGWWRSEGRWVMTALIDPAGDPPEEPANRAGIRKESVR